MTWKKSGSSLWLWDVYSIELCADKYELYQGTKFKGAFESLLAAKTYAYGVHGLVS